MRSQVKWYIKISGIIALVVSILVVTYFYGGANKLSEGAWGKAVKGVQAKIYCKKSRYRIWEAKAVIRIKYRNIGEETVTLEHEQYETLNFSHNDKPYADGIGSGSISESDIVLKPGESCDYNLSAFVFKHTGKGIYEVKGARGGFELPSLKITVE